MHTRHWNPTSALPIDPLLSDVFSALKTSSNLVLTAAPGAGKTTRVAPYLLHTSLLKPGSDEILLLQPRRVAARSIASRIASENKWCLGEEVGYQVRFENRTGVKTKLKLMTEGILAKRLQQDPYLEGVGLVILDEFHERSLHTDLALAMLRSLQIAARPDLHILVMSATMDPHPVSLFLGACPVIESIGRQYPVDIRHLPKQSNTLDFRTLIQTTAQSILQIVHEKFDGPGHILVFLPGQGEIQAVKNQLQTHKQIREIDIWPLHGRLSNEEQERALAPSARRKIILATNIAETSLTIDGVTIVVDSGLARVNRVDWALGTEHLELNRISLASATQRAGRAGRQYPGQCLRLWSIFDEKSMAPSQEPEILRSLLADTCLFLADQGYSDLSTFHWYETPPRPALLFARKQLEELGAVDHKTGQVTLLGRELLRWPLNVRLARVMDEATKQGYYAEGARLVALLSERDVLRDPLLALHHHRHSSLESDLMLRYELVAENAPELDSRSLRNVEQLERQLKKNLPADRPRPSLILSDDLLCKLLLVGFSDRVCRRRQAGDPRAIMVGKRGLRLAASSVVKNAELFLALDVRESRGKTESQQSEAVITLASAIKKEWLIDLFPGETVEKTEAYFDPAAQKIFAERVRAFRDLPIESASKYTPGGDEVSGLLAEVMSLNPEKYFDKDSPVGRWFLRYRLAKEIFSEYQWREEIPFLKESLAELCLGSQTVREVLEKPIVAYLESKLTREQNQVLRNELPETVEVPSGSRLKIQYDPEQRAAVLAVRLQELFGWTKSPSIAKGRLPLIIHLLSPGYKPVQVTSDLESFWQNTYHEVRKELRARYPKHSWPEDPLSAKPEAKGGRKRF